MKRQGTQVPTAGPLWQREGAQNSEDARKMGCKGLILSACGVAGQLGARPCASQVPVLRSAVRSTIFCLPSPPSSGPLPLLGRPPPARWRMLGK